MSPEQARSLLVVREPIPAAMTSPTGRLLDAEGGQIDPRQTVSWVMALGPFGSWPSTLADAEADFAKHPEWTHAESFRLGWVVVHRPGWGYAAHAPDPSAAR
jgi:hypothetical protein